MMKHRDGKEVRREGPSLAWRKVIFTVSTHVIAIRGLTLMHKFQTETLIFGLITYCLAGLGITAGAHRLWSHQSYKAKLPLRIFLALMSCAAWQTPIFQWSRDHRTHHKFTDTNADPHQCSLGLFFSHFGPIFYKKHPDVARKGSTLSVNDLLSDPVVRIQKRFFRPVSIFMCILLPTWVPFYFWNESVWLSFCATMLRYCLTLNASLSVNSFAHWAGSRSYDKSHSSTDNKLVAMFAMGEGFHNYHHAFPQDYSTSELGFKLNPTKAFIDVMAFFGQAYDRKVTDEDQIQERRERTGDL